MFIKWLKYHYSVSLVWGYCYEQDGQKYSLRGLQFRFKIMCSKFNQIHHFLQCDSIIDHSNQLATFAYKMRCFSI